MRQTALLLVLTYAAHAQVESPVLGLVVQPDGRLDRVTGTPGAANAVTLRSGVFDAIRLPDAAALKTAEAVEFLSFDGRTAGQFEAPSGSALFSRHPSSSRLFALFAVTGEFREYSREESGLWVETPVLAMDVGGTSPIAMTAVSRSVLRVALESAEGISVEDVNIESGARSPIGWLAGRHGPAAFDERSQLTFPPSDQGVESISSLEDGWFALRGEEGVRAFRPGSNAVVLPRATDSALTISWRKTLTEEILVGDSFVMPSAAPGAPSEARFRVRNTGSVPANVFRLVVEGAEFALFNDFVVPATLAPNGVGEFWIRYSPAGIEPAAGRLRLNDINVTLQGSPAPITVPEWLDNGTWRSLSASAANRLGETERDAEFSRTLRMRASMGEPEIPAVSSPYSLSPNGGGLYTLKLDTSAYGMAEAQLQVSGRSYRLQVFVMEPAPPRPSLKLSASALGYARQEPIQIQLSEEPKTSASGQLTLAFQPESSALGDDATLGFLPNLARTVSFTIAPGSTLARFSGGDTLTLQTGTTAGTLILTATLAGIREEQRLRLEPAAPGLQTATIQALDQRVSLRLTAYDPLRASSRAAFTFYLRNGQPVSPGRIEVDVSGAFKSYFSDPAINSSGFVLNALFPVSGTLGELASVELELTNPAGTTRSNRLQIQ